MKIYLLSFAIILIASLTTSCKKAPSPPPEPDLTAQHRARISELESKLQLQQNTNERWQLICLSLGAGGLVLLIVGTSLGAKTRHDALTPSL